MATMMGSSVQSARHMRDRLHQQGLVASSRQDPSSHGRTQRRSTSLHDVSVRNLLEDFEARRTTNTRLNRAAVVEFCEGTALGIETDVAPHMVLTAETTELMDSDKTGSSKWGLELWRLLKNNFDRPSAFNIVSVLETIHRLAPARAMHSVLSKPATLERVHREYPRQALACACCEVRCGILSGKSYTRRCHTSPMRDVRFSQGNLTSA